MKVIRFFACLTVLSALACAQSASESQESASPAAEAPAKAAAPASEKAKVSSSGENLHLTIMKTVVSPTETTNGIGDRQCDSDGNLYLGTDTAIYPGIRKLNSKGELVASFKPNTNPDVKIYGAGKFFVTSDGEVYQWVGEQDSFSRYALIFKNDGTYKSNIKFDPGFAWTPATIAVFPHGEILMTGQQFAKVNGIAQPAIPFTGIFSTDGRLLKRLDLEGDGQVKDAALASKAPPTAIPSDHTITWGHLASASDGNIYVMRYVSPAAIYAISPGGEVVQKFTVDPGSASLMPQDIRISGNRIAIFFWDLNSHTKIMKVVDLEGHEIATYDDQPSDRKSQPVPLIALGCYAATPEHFTFVSYGENGKIHFQEVEAH